MKKTAFLVFFLFCKLLTYAQIPFQSKCPPSVIQRDHDKGPQNFALVVYDVSAFHEWAGAQKVEIIRIYHPANIVVIRTTYYDLTAKILPLSNVLFADDVVSEPHEELSVPGHNLFVNKINVVHSKFPDVNGAGITMSLKEYRFDTADVDLKNRAVNAPDAAPSITSHANIMATLMAGAGNSDQAGRGVATATRLISNGFNNLLPEDDYASVHVTVQNHSYGLDIENYYGAGALAYDKSIEENPSLVHVFSAGNRGQDTSRTGTYANVPGFANLTGNFKMAKNVLTVGAVDSFGQVTPFSSHGPAYDGRVKPDLVAFGQDGSSGSAALVSGACAVLQQTYLDQTGAMPAASLVRAVLINSADDINPPGPDYFSGFGDLNLKSAVQLIENQNFETGEVSNNDILSFPIDMLPGISKLKVTLAWDDPAADINSSKSLVNDLDLSILAPDGTEWLPWGLNIIPDADALQIPAMRRRDTLNNVEQVTLDFPYEGKYTILVKGSKLGTDMQAFSLAWSIEQSDDFIWTFPVKKDAGIAGEDVLLRWENTFSDTTGLLEFRYVDSPLWHMIDPAVDLRKEWFRWLLPDTFAEAQVRMRLGGKIYESDTFLISRVLRMRTGFNCPDSVYLVWNTITAGASYLLSGLGEKKMEPLLVLTDTFIVLQKMDFPQERFNVTPVGQGGVAGLQSATLDISMQGVSCYFETFLAALNADYQTDLTLRIGTRYGVHSIFFEKIKDGSFSTIEIWQPIDSEEFKFTDKFTRPGVNRYRARLKLENGATLFSDTLAVYLLDQNELLVFPNPVNQNTINVIANTLGEASFVLFDLQGCLMLEENLDDIPMKIALPAGIPKGCYPYFLRENGRLKSGGILLLGF